MSPARKRSLFFVALGMAGRAKVRRLMPGYLTAAGSAR